MDRAQASPAHGLWEAPVSDRRDGEQTSAEKDADWLIVWVQRLQPARVIGFHPAAEENGILHQNWSNR